MEQMLLITNLVIAVGLGTLSQATTIANGLTEEIACFNTIFSVSCAPHKVIVFDSARYGRNDTHVAARCGVPFSRHCDVDVHFLMNRACAGRRKCNVIVNTALFGDPCGYEEFLRITYLCIPVSTVHNTCFSAFSPPVFHHGYLSTPNYPDKYFMDADCTWRLAVQRRQSVRITIFDFELDLKRGGSCRDFLEIVAEGGRSQFKDCGILGKQVVEVDASKVTVRFVTGQSSLTQRGFFLSFEGVGPGCSQLKSGSNAFSVVHFLDGDQLLSANVSCWEGLSFSGLGVSSLLLKCVDSAWTQEIIPNCTESHITRSTHAGRRLTVPLTDATNSPPEREHNNGVGSLSKSASIIGFALGVISSIFFVVLLILVLIYCYLRRKNRNSAVSIDKWRVVINNLQEHSAKQQEHATYRHFSADDSVSNILRAGAPTAPVAPAPAHRPRHASNRSVPASLRSSQTQQQQHAFTAAGDPTLDKRQQRRPPMPIWAAGSIPVPVPPDDPSYCAAEDCTCCCCSCGASDGAATTGTKTSGVLPFDTDSVVTGETADVRTTCCSGTDCCHRRRYEVMGFASSSSRGTLSPCCSYLGTVESFRSPVAAETEDETEVETDLNSPDSAAAVGSCSAPDLFTITRMAAGHLLLDATENSRIETV